MEAPGLSSRARCQRCRWASYTSSPASSAGCGAMSGGGRNFSASKPASKPVLERASMDWRGAPEISLTATSFRGSAVPLGGELDGQHDPQFLSERLARCGVGAADLSAVEGDPRVGGDAGAATTTPSPAPTPAAPRPA